MARTFEELVALNWVLHIEGAQVLQQGHHEEVGGNTLGKHPLGGELALTQPYTTHAVTALLIQVRLWKYKRIKVWSPIENTREYSCWFEVRLCRGQALVKNSKRPPDFRFSNFHSPTQYFISLDFLNATVPLQSIVSLFYSINIGIVPKENVRWCSSTDFIIDIALSVILKFQFSHSQPGYKGKYHYSRTQSCVAYGYGTSV